MVLLPIAYLTFFLMMNNRRMLGDHMPQGGRRKPGSTWRCVWHWGRRRWEPGGQSGVRHIGTAWAEWLHFLVLVGVVQVVRGGGPRDESAGNPKPPHLIPRNVVGTFPIPRRRDHMGGGSRLLVWLVLLVPAVGTAAERPNVVFFLVDDLGWTDLGCFGSSFYDTPHVDGLARSGMKFTNAYAACPVCSPTRASILSGKISVTNRHHRLHQCGGGATQPGKWRRNTRLLPSPYKDRMAHKEVTLAEALKEAGYATFFCRENGTWVPSSSGPKARGSMSTREGSREEGRTVGKSTSRPMGTRD